MNQLFMAINLKNIFYYLSLVFLMLCSCAGIKQITTYSEFKIDRQVSLFEVDNLNNVYIVSGKNELSKWNNKGDLLYKYSDNRLGEIGILDVSNPLQTLVYYPDFRWLRFYDRTLNLTSELSLLELGFQNVNVVNSSNDNNIWFFDEINQIILKIDQEGQVLIRSDDLRQVLKKSIFPTKLFEKKNTLLLYDQNFIYTFDAFGTFMNEFEIGSVISLTFNGKEAQYIDSKDQLLSVNVISKTAEIGVVEQMDSSILGYRKGLDCRFYKKKDHILIKKGVE